MYHAADGVHSPISRAAIVVAGSDGGFGEGAHDQRLRHADAQFTGQQLEQREALPALEPAQPLEHLALLLVGVRAAQRQDAILDPRRRD